MTGRRSAWPEPHLTSSGGKNSGAMKGSDLELTDTHTSLVQGKR